MRYQQPSMEGTLFAMRNKEGARDMVKNVLIGQAVSSLGNAVLDLAEPTQRKREEEKDFGDRTRDFLRTVVNIAPAANTGYQLFRALGAPEEKSQSQGPDIKLASNYRRQEKSPADIDFEVNYGDAANRSQPLTTTERTRQGEEVVKAARAERMPGLVVTDLSTMVDDATMNRLRGLEKEAASYPKKREEPSDYEKGVAAGMEAMTMRNLQSQAPSQTIDVTFTDAERRSTPYRAPERSSNPLLSREPMGFNETFGVKEGVPMARAARKAEDEESLANFYANLPTNRETGEREVGNFASDYLVSKGSIAPETVRVVDPEVDQPRNSGGLLQGQLRGETLYNQQENREPFVQDQQMDAIYSGDEQGPGFKSSRGAAQEQMQNFMAQMLSDNAASSERIQEQVAARETPRFAPSPEMVPNYVKPERRTVATEERESSALVAPSMTISSEPTVKKTTIIEETVPTAPQRMSPLEASEKLRRIQTSGRPTARQEAQDFLNSMKEQMIDG